MSKIPSNLFYTKDHEWIVEEEGGSFLIGITDHAQENLGDVTYVEMPSVGDEFENGEVFGVVESVKAASDLYMPISGKVTEVNDELNDFPEKVNSDPYSDGWMIRILPKSNANLETLLNHTQYSSEIGNTET
ncbi:MAG: glycine cleavage system protein H [Opitutae bacterium]|nr:glycine cleavage system protein H [Opitutae bacterium]|tara:strand:+ start:5708 stop:6103 length:396 start_codon:yes stop_codon:yes gene_type:complete